MKRLLVILALAYSAAAQIVTIQGNDSIKSSRTIINDNFSRLNLNKAGLSACPAGQVAIETLTSGVRCVALDASYIPNLSGTYQAVSGKNQPGGYVGLDANGNAAIGTTVPGAYTGSVVGTPTFSAAKFASGMGGASSTKKLSLPGTLFSQFAPTDSWTLEAWISTTAPSTQVVIGTGTNQLWFGIGVAHKCTFSVTGTGGFSGNTQLIASAAPNANDGAWHHCAVTVQSGTTIKIWQDGTLGNTYTGVYTPTSGTTWAGDFPIQTGTFAWTDGQFDEIAVWRGVRYSAPFTPATVAYTGSENNLIALYHLDGDASDSRVQTAVSMTSGGITDLHNAPSLRASFTNSGSTLTAATVCTIAASSGTIKTVTLMSDGTSGNATVDLTSETFNAFLAGTAPTSMTAGNPVTLAAARGTRVDVFTGWTSTTITAGTVYCFALSSPASIVGLSVVVTY